MSDAIRIYLTGDCDGFDALRKALAEHAEIEVVGESAQVAQATGVLAGGHLDCVLHATREAAFPAAELAAIRAGLPAVDGSASESFIPQMLNLDTLGAVAFAKGCYPGQEIVARAQYRGQVKRRMVRLPAPPGARLQPGQEYNGGTVVDSAGGELLAVMPV